MNVMVECDAAGWTYNRWLGRWRPASCRAGLKAGAARAGGCREETGLPFEVSDRVLVERAVGGDDGAFEQIHRRYYGRIQRMAYLRLGSHEDAADVACGTFVKAFTALPSFKFPRSLNSLFPWLHRIATNLITDQVRRRKRSQNLSLDAQVAEDLESFLDYLPSDGPGPQELVERQEVQAAVRAAVALLPADQARAIEMRYFGDLSMREMAAALDRTEGAVKSLLHRALGNMRRELSQITAAAGAEGRLRATGVGKTTSGVETDEVIEVHRRDA